MKSKLIATALLSGSLILSSCGASNAVKGGGIGAAAGALLGAGVGKVVGNAGIGAAIGAVVGGASGALIGNKMDKQKKELEKSLENAKVESINEGQAIKVTFDSGILFATGKADLSPKAKEALVSFASSAQSNNLTNIQIIGHTDNTGSDRINNPLSLERAKSVETFLAAQGIARSRMTSDGKGSYAPIADNSTAEGRRENRRVEIYILPSQEMIQAAENGTLK